MNRSNLIVLLALIVSTTSIAVEVDRRAQVRRDAYFAKQNRIGNYKDWPQYKEESSDDEKLAPHSTQGEPNRDYSWSAENEKFDWESEQKEVHHEHHKPEPKPEEQKWLRYKVPVEAVGPDAKDVVLPLAVDEVGLPEFPKRKKNARRRHRNHQAQQRVVRVGAEN